MFKNLPITTKLTYICTAVLTFLLLIVFTIQFYMQYNSIYAEVISGYERTTTMLSEESNGGIKWKKAAGLKKVYNNFLSVNGSEHLLHIAFFNDQGTLLTHISNESYKGDNSQFYPKSTPTDVSSKDSSNGLEVVAPSHDPKSGKVIGYVYTFWSLETLQKMVVQTIISQVIFGLLFIIITITILYYLLKTQLKKPLIEMISNIESVIENASNKTSKVRIQAQEMQGIAQESMGRTNDASDRSKTISDDVQHISAAAEELNASLHIIGRSINETSESVKQATLAVGQSSEHMNEMNTATQTIEAFTSDISSIADQTNLLALNASIEAARAGESGRGFSVVAEEIKKLATLTSKTTADITNHVSSISQAVNSSQDALILVKDTIERIEGQSSEMLASIKEQEMATSDITQSMSNANDSISDMDEIVQVISKYNKETSDSSESVYNSTDELKEGSDKLKLSIHEFSQKI
ncbi:MAG: methyl-accepting chemotaxis protein [Alphaproteobacteria bacterium]|jgi:methyl-accepting chemotaxis protein